MAWSRGIRRFLGSPARISLVSFALLIAFGTLLLTLPISSRGPRIGLIDALFLSTSGACVTGLSVVDIASRLSPIGQIILLALIQVGGIGMMTLSTLFMLLAGKQLGPTPRSVVKDSFSNRRDRSARSILRDVVLVTACAESLGLLILWLRFAPDFGLAEGFRQALFHSVSAFCNAGFSLFSDNLVAYRGDPVVNGTVALLVVLGGLGFLVISESSGLLAGAGRRRWRSTSLHTKLVLSTTGLLLVVSTTCILAMEWNNALQGMPPGERLLAAFFQAVSVRTAGFNTIPIGQFTSGTLFFLMFLMFIGGGPGSCAGGIKTTTFATLTLLGWARLTGRSRLTIFSRSIAEKSVGRSISVLMLSMLVVAVATLLLLLFELPGLSHAAAGGRFLDLFFEATSAFGTVGLSTGVTPSLGIAGKLIVTLTMFVGRIGPLAVAIAASRDEILPIRYAEEEIMVG